LKVLLNWAKRWGCWNDVPLEAWELDGSCFYECSRNPYLSSCKDILVTNQETLAIMRRQMIWNSCFCISWFRWTPKKQILDWMDFCRVICNISLPQLKTIIRNLRKGLRICKQLYRIFHFFFLLWTLNVNYLLSNSRQRCLTLHLFRKQIWKQSPCRSLKWKNLKLIWSR